MLGQLTDAESRQYLSEALTLCYTTYENGRLERVMKKLGTTRAADRGRSMSLNYQAERFTCSWPWSTAILLCDGRDLVRLLRSLRQARARRHPRRQPGRGVARTDGHRTARGHQHRRLGLLRRLPA